MPSGIPASDDASAPAPAELHHHVWQEFNFWLVAFTAIYSLISIFALWVAIRSARLAKQSADASIATVRAWVDAHSFKFTWPLPKTQQRVSPEFSMTVENLGRTPARDLLMTIEFAFDDSAADKQFKGCPEADPSRVPFMMAGPPGEPWVIPVTNVVADDFARLKPGAGSTASVYAHGCIRYRDVMTEAPRVTEFCVRYHGGNSYVMCDNGNLME